MGVFEVLTSDQPEEPFLEKHLCGSLCTEDLEANQHLECELQEGRELCFVHCSVHST